MKKPKIRFKMTFFSVLVLVLIFFLFFSKGGRTDSLFSGNNTMTLYAQCRAGEEPDIRFEDFFPDGGYDYEKFSYDSSSCDFSRPGTYLMPVSYDGKLTNCAIQVTVKGPDETLPETKGSDRLPGDGLNNP